MQPAKLTLIKPDWPAPPNVHCAISCRNTGHSMGSYAAGNLALHVEDDPVLVAENRRLLKSQLGLEHIQWLEQVHGTHVVAAKSDGLTRTADGCITGERKLACAVMTADCLPLLLCNKAGTQVAAVHAGWRGLAKGVIAEAVKQFDCKPNQLLAYLGPAIGKVHFEVGVDVLEAFFELAANAEAADAIANAFQPSMKPLKFHTDLYALARLALAQLGINAVYGGNFCTYEDKDRFYSYRRNAKTGRMASLIWLD